MATSTLISDPAKPPTVLTVRDGGGIVLSQPGTVIALDAEELARLIAATSPEPTTPAKARMLRYPATQQTSATPKPATQQTHEPADG